MRAELAVLALAVLSAHPAAAQGPTPLLDERGALAEAALEALLAPAEREGALFTHATEGDDAQFCLDVSEGDDGVRAALNPARIRWPRVGGVAIAVRGEGFALAPAGGEVDGGALDRPIRIRWTLRPLGQVFEPRPAFELEVVEARVEEAATERLLFSYRAAEAPPRCIGGGAGGGRICNLPGVGREVSAIAMDPEGELLAVALGGLKPRVEVYAVGDEPALAWTALFPTSAGGLIEVAFSTDGRWVVALTGDGRLHRFDASSGGLHLAIPSRGRAARALPPGTTVAVAGDGGEVTLWNLADGTIAWRLPARDLRGPVDELAASGDGRRFATLEYDADKTVVRVWDTARRACLAQIEVDPYAVADIALDERGERVFISHEEKGLLVAAVSAEGGVGAPAPFGGQAGARCRNRLFWLSAGSVIGCAVARGVLELGADGRPIAERDAGAESADWIVTAARGGARTAAAGGGHLLVWIDPAGR